MVVGVTARVVVGVSVRAAARAAARAAVRTAARNKLMRLIGSRLLSQLSVVLRLPLRGSEGYSGSQGN
jgi:hypothetical protein